MLLKWHHGGRPRGEKALKAVLVEQPDSRRPRSRSSRSAAPSRGAFSRDAWNFENSRGNTCSEYSESSECGMFDTDKFKANQMCTICGGGIDVVQYCNQTRVIIENQKKCYENINQTRNVEYCDAKLNSDFSWSTPEKYFDCY